LWGFISNSKKITAEGRKVERWTDIGNLYCTSPPIQFDSPPIHSFYRPIQNPDGFLLQLQRKSHPTPQGNHAPPPGKSRANPASAPTEPKIPPEPWHCGA
jgi:hypothetical protein